MKKLNKNFYFLLKGKENEWKSALDETCKNLEDTYYEYRKKII